MKVELDEKVAGITHRDTHSKALLNSDMDAFLKYKKRKQKMLDQKNTNKSVSELKEELHDLKSEITQIKEMITLLITNK